MRSTPQVERMGRKASEAVEVSADKARHAARRAARRAKMQAQAEARWHSEMENGYFVQGHRAVR